MNTNSEVSIPAPAVATGIETPYLESGFAGVVVSITILLLKVILTDWLKDQQMIREMLKQKNETKD